ncbi:AFL072Cp [Eremothecium gossypii ATCC 10895]|uniref:AFL072Cp n=1 Tax=Eremothecium gossypii (strain ATCC 10895 / CBS 109.51 / FGSC 9923 / NRRL Y-1056) TaxID=284811 RepID=Q754Y3_EREGS|nr:AFL072Cp [Eremothecium gossypii ATCC 10895]AAS53300.1 AFL072Cp [Eremothecium gossypii ATCC 10895]AEY97611.1 FAFL072Cp [Eremothecium gossypii FDAG1]
MEHFGSHEQRRLIFNINEGLAEVIGRASERDAERVARADNLFFAERSLSKQHAMLYVKRFTGPGGAQDGDEENIRIWVEDLGSTHGLVDLQSTARGVSQLIDLKNGERFGVVYMDKPITSTQSRGARLKFQVNVMQKQGPLWELLVRDVTFGDSPCITKGSPLDGTDGSLTPYHTEPSSDWSYSEMWCGEDMCRIPSDVECSHHAHQKERNMLQSNYVDLLQHQEELGVPSSAAESDFGSLDEPVKLLDEYEKGRPLLPEELHAGQQLGPSVGARAPRGEKHQRARTIWSARSILFGTLFGFVIGFIFGAANLD